MRDLFSTALARLTVLYVAVLAIVCLLFSGFIYTLASNEIDRTSRRQVVGFRNLLGRFIVDEIESEKLRIGEADESRSRLRTNLFLGNLAVIGAGTILSYFFAKKTLKPLEEGVRSQERFTSDASHELRTPLASMRTEIEVALRDKDLKIKDAKELLESNLEEVETLQSLTDNLLSLARNRELGESKIEDISKIIQIIIRRSLPKFKKEGMTLTSEIANNIKTSTNKEGLQQVLNILLENSMKYAGEGKATRVTVSALEGTVFIKVSDDGIGISADKVDHIFERFYKVDTSRTGSKGTGHGLGLSIAKQLVNALHGKIYASRPKVGGVEFSIELPIVV